MWETASSKLACRHQEVVHPESRVEPDGSSGSPNPTARVRKQSDPHLCHSSISTPRWRAFCGRCRVSHERYILRLNSGRLPPKCCYTGDATRSRAMVHDECRCFRSERRFGRRASRGQGDAVGGLWSPTAAGSGTERSQRTSSGGPRRAAPVMPFGRGRVARPTVIRCARSGASLLRLIPVLSPGRRCAETS